MDKLVVKNASTFHGSNVKGYITAWQSDQTRMSSMFGEIVPTYEHVYSWPIYRSKAQATDILKLIAILAYVDSLDFEYTMNNTSASIYSERDNIQIILYTDDQTLMEYSNQDVLDLIEDGFIDPRCIHESMLNYYKYIERNNHD